MKANKHLLVRTGMVAILVAGLWSSGCSTSDPGAKRDAIPLDSFVRGLAEAYCAALDHCDLGDFGNYLWSATQQARCAEDLARLIWGEGGFAQTQAYTYDGEAAAACLESFEGLCPPGGEMDPGDWCPEAFSGCSAAQEPWNQPVPEGAACDGATCNAGLRCTGDPYTCQRRVLSGGMCIGSECAVGSTCGADSVCGPLPPDQAQDPLDHPLGAPCQVSDYLRQGGCNVGFVCLLGTMTCGQALASGAACQSGRECASAVCDASTGACGEPAGRAGCSGPPPPVPPPGGE